MVYMTVELLPKACSNCMVPFFRVLMGNGREQLAVQSCIPDTWRFGRLHITSLLAIVKTSVKGRNYLVIMPTNISSLTTPNPKPKALKPHLGIQFKAFRKLGFRIIPENLCAPLPRYELSLGSGQPQQLPDAHRRSAVHNLNWPQAKSFCFWKFLTIWGI